MFGLILWIVLIWLEVERNYHLIEKEKEKPDYLHSFGVRAFLGILGLVFMCKHDPFLEWELTVPYFVYEVTSFYLIFDLWLNLKRGKPLDYQGKQSGWLDKLGKPFYYTLKILCLVLLILSLTIILA